MENLILIVLVLYKKEIQETPNYSLLAKLLKNSNTLFLVVIDNSPTSHEDVLFEARNVHYVHYKENIGLAKAYNQGVKWFYQEQAQLLLLLDHDTAFDEHYLRHLQTLSLDDEIGAYVPCIKSGTKQLSPVYSNRYIGATAQNPKPGIYSKDIMAINSGTVLTRLGIDKIGRFNQEFPLDFLDHWLFFTLLKQQLKIVVLDDQLQHDLSVLNYATLSLERYLSILSAETTFYKNYDTDKFFKHRKHLLLRGIKQFFLVKNRKIWQATIAEFFKLRKEKK